MKKPKISVIIPVYNSSRALKETLSSLQKQTFKDFEIIVADDCSTDDSPKVAKEYAKVKIIKTTTNSGPATARNLGIKEASADIIAFIDSDCIADKDWLKNIHSNFKNKEIMVLMGKVKIPHSTFLGDSIAALGYPAGSQLGFENMYKVTKEGFTTNIVTCNCALRKNIFNTIGSFDQGFHSAFGEDVDFSARLLKKGIKIKYSPNIMITHEPRKDLKSFIRWAVNRGKGSYYLKKKVKLKNIFKLRLWSTKNIIKKYYKDIKLPLIMFLLFCTFILQEIGYFKEALRRKYKI